MNELAELPGIGRVNSPFTVKLVKGCPCQIGKATCRAARGRIR